MILNSSTAEWFIQRYGSGPWSGGFRQVEPQDFEEMPRDVLVDLLDSARMNGLDQADFLEAVLLGKYDLFVMRGYKEMQVMVTWRPDRG